MDTLITILFIIAIIFAGLYFFSRWTYKKMAVQEDLLSKNKQAISIFVIDKQKSKPSDVNLPKQIFNQLPKYTKMLKIPFVKAKVGNQILTLMCDKKVFELLPLKKNVKVEIAGIYIISVAGMKEKPKKNNKKDSEKHKKA